MKKSIDPQKSFFEKYITIIVIIFFVILISVAVATEGFS
jgi:hypothetical protein